MKWPGNSPDMNPIENCWYQVGKKIAQKKPKNKQELIETIKNVWNNDLDIEYIRKLISSMPDRCKAVIAARGGTTKY